MTMVESRPQTAEDGIRQTWKVAPERIDAAKRSFVTRRVVAGEMTTLVRDEPPRAGDLVLARIERLRQHQRIETMEGRRAHLHPDDEVILAYGNRYAPDQFEGVVPDDLGPVNMVAAGGVAAKMIHRHEQIKPATEISPIGLIGDADGRPLNLKRYRISHAPAQPARPPTIAVVGASMNSGKTTMAAALVHGLTRAGLRVGAAKVTGTGSGGDLWMMLDSGASRVVDFTDAGHPSTYRVGHDEVVETATGLIGHLGEMDAIVVEVADGLFQRETNALLETPEFVRVVDGFLFASGDALAATAGVSWMCTRGLFVLGAGGLLTRSPLSLQEAQANLRMPVLTRSELSDPGVASRLIASRPAVIESCA